MVSGKRSLTRTFTDGVQAPRKVATDSEKPCPEGSEGCEDNGSSTTVAQNTACPAEQAICGSCGHNLGANECCQATHAAKRARTKEGVGGTAEGTLSSRAGERKRQEHRRLLEDASKRQRLIPTVEAASNPAQLIMARMKARLRKEPPAD